MYSIFIKRILDFSISLIGLIIISPLFILITILLYFTNRGKPFFVQERVGKGEQIFRIIKFKTMNDKTDKNGNLLPDTQRLTFFGSFIRKTSLDEIPQLINILKGEMSLIGPRPLLVRYQPYYTKPERNRHSVNPGITGLAQISGRNNLNWEDRFKIDLEYVNNISFLLDLKIIIKTIQKVITSKDIVVDPSSTLQDLDEYRRKN